MKLTYTGMQAELPEKQREKIDKKLAKIAKMIEHAGEKDAHMRITQERFLKNAEVTVRAYDHDLIGAASDADLFTAVCGAVDHLEKQVVKMRAKWRAMKRHKEAPQRTPDAAIATEAAVEEQAQAPAAAGKKALRNGSGREETQKVFRVDHHESRKPMTIDEAMIEMGAARNYFVYRDSNTDRLSVLVRRKDGHFDLIES
ncbi:MAG: ribosome hibernation-promoting factor, HPF/YfiA family [Bryobacteraceae bacterium]